MRACYKPILPWWYHTLILQGGSAIGFSALFILGVVLGFLWIGVTETDDDQARPSHAQRSYPNRTNAMIFALCGGLLGSRAVFVVLHSSYYQAHPGEIIAIWQGGLSASGGIIGVFLGLGIYTWSDRRHLWRLLDDLAIPAAMLGITGWIGCWLEGVAYGRQVAWQWGWLMNSDPFSDQIARWPTQLLGVLLSLLTFLVLFRFNPRWPVGVKGLLTGSVITGALVVVGLFRADPSMLLMGMRLDIIGPAALALMGLGTTAYRWFEGGRQEERR